MTKSCLETQSSKDAAADAPAHDLPVDVSYPENDGSRAYFLVVQARARIKESKESEAIALCDQAIAEAIRTNTPKMQIWAMTVKATSAAVEGQLKVGFAAATEALELARANHDLILEARALLAIAFVALETYDEDQAHDVLQRALVCARAGSSAADTFWALNNLSHIYGERAMRMSGNPEARQPILDALAATAGEALELAEQTQDWYHRCYALLNLANGALIQGNSETASVLVTGYSRLARVNGSPRLAAFADIDFARLYLLRGDFARAIDVISTETHLEQGCQTDDLKLRTQELLAELYKRLGQFELAFSHLQTVRMIERRMQDFKAERQVAIVTARMEMEEARAEAERLKLQAASLALRNELLEKDRAALERDAALDPLTGLGNRRAADRALDHHFQIARAEERPFSLAYLDIDHFKQINDAFGHPMGDQVLTTLASLLRKCLRGDDDVFRFGGEEFVILFPKQDAKSGRAICERIRRTIQDHHWSLLDPRLAVTASMGLAELSKKANIEALLATADSALYEAKNSGRNTVVVGSIPT